MISIPELTEKDLHVPDLEDSIWEKILADTGLLEVWKHSSGWQYQKSLIEYFGSNNVDIVILDSLIPGLGKGGYVLRFKSESAKLAFLLKWS